MTKQPNPIDVLVGKNIRIYRVAQNFSQGKLAAALGITFQQVQKYENGTNRVSSSRIVQIAKFLNVPITRLFEDVSRECVEGSEGDRIVDFLNQPHAIRMLRAFSNLRSNKTRLSLAVLTEGISDSEG
jgi:transcriptional regulator with XRE-family HTH domain